VGANPTRRPLQPEATGAVTEVTKWLKRLWCSWSRIGGRASVRAATRVNAQQASQRVRVKGSFPGDKSPAVCPVSEVLSPLAVPPSRTRA
jgi:hypothetical protein